jgi:hypothetical protein
VQAWLLAGITTDSTLFAVEQFAGGRGGIIAMNQAQRAVDTNVHFHADVPLVTFFGLVHFRRLDDSVALISAALVELGA